MCWRVTGRLRNTPENYLERRVEFELWDRPKAADGHDN
jgi:hypothetical protein